MCFRDLQVKAFYLIKFCLASVHRKKVWNTSWKSVEHISHELFYLCHPADITASGIKAAIKHLLVSSFVWEVSACHKFAPLSTNVMTLLCLCLMLSVVFQVADSWTTHHPPLRWCFDGCVFVCVPVCVTMCVIVCVCAYARVCMCLDACMELSSVALQIWRV